MRAINLKNKRGAFEMSMSTIIIIVLSVSFLILGLVLLKNIYGASSKSINILDEKLGSELQKIFTDENKNLVIYLGEDKKASVRAGTTDFGVGIAAQTINNVRLEDKSKVQYQITLDESSPKGCMKILGKTRTVGLFNQGIGVWLNSTAFDGPISKFQIRVNIPASTQICTQLVEVTAKDFSVVPEGEVIAMDSFTLEVLKKGLF
jgi:hypothetical protein